MATSILLSEDNFFKSNQIKIYPASFRGVYSDNNTKFDPESTLTTEYNITRPLMAGDKETYIISWNETDRKLTCVIGGYYFEISNITASALANKYLCITKRTIDLTDESGVDSQRNTLVLANFRDSSASLDELEKNKGYFFTGLLISDSAAGDFRLKAFLDGGVINYSEFIPNIKSGDGNAENQPTALVFGNKAKATANRSIALGDGARAEGDHSFAIGKGASATEIGSLAIGHDVKASKENAIALGKDSQALAEGAVAIGAESKASGTNSQAHGYRVTAEGKYSQASGNQTKAMGEASVAEGDSTIASGNYSHASGKETRAAGICSNAFGNNTIAGSENQFVLGTFNDNKEGNIFEIGNGKTGDLKNIFEIDNEGNTALHSLKASGNIEVTGNTNLSNKVKVEIDRINLTAPTTFDDIVTIKNKLTISKDLEVNGKLTTTDKETTIYNQLKIQNNEKEDKGDYNLIYDSKAGCLAIGNHLNKGKGSVSFTSDSDASGDNAFTIGISNRVSGANSAAFGYSNEVSGSESFASGNENTVTKAGAMVVGDNNTNEKTNAVVFGVGNTANSDRELVIGKYNTKDTEVNTEYFAIGNGTGPAASKRSTAFKVVKKEQNSQTEVFIDDKSVAAHVSEDTNFKEFLLNSLYPIGSVYIYSGDKKNITKTKTIEKNGRTLRTDYCECPIASLGGEWTPIQNYFLYTGDQSLNANSASYNAINATGGSNRAYLINHNHTATGTYKGYPNQITDSLGNNKTLSGKFLTGRGEYERTLHAVPGLNPTKDTACVADGIIKVYSGYSNKWTPEYSKQTLQEVQVRPLQDHRPDQIEIDVRHEHRMSTDKVTVQVDSTGDILPADNTANMPQYLCVYAWKRVK